MCSRLSKTFIVKHHGELEGRPKVRKTDAHEIVILNFPFGNVWVLNTVKKQPNQIYMHNRN